MKNPSPDPRSRYRATATAVYSDGTHTVSWLMPRILPLTATVPLTGSTVLPRAGERLDQLATRTMGDPLSAWQLTDANAGLDPFAFIEERAAGVAVPLPRVPQ